MLDVVWLNLVELSKHPVFKSILTKVNDNHCLIVLYDSYSRYREQKKNGNVGLILMPQKKRISLVDTKNHWMCLESYYSSAPGHQTGHWPRLGSISMILLDQIF